MGVSTHGMAISIVSVCVFRTHMGIWFNGSLSTRNGTFDRQCMCVLHAYNFDYIGNLDRIHGYFVHIGIWTAYMEVSYIHTYVSFFGFADVFLGCFRLGDELGLGS